MFKRNFLAPALMGALGLSLMLPMVGCGGDAEASVDQTRNADGTHTTTSSVKVKIKWARPESPVTTYALQFQEYPANRMVLQTSVTYPYGLNYNDSEHPVTLPGTLSTDARYSFSCRVGSWVNVYQGPLASTSTLANGSYVIDCPGMMEDIVLAARTYPSEPIEVTVAGVQGSSLSDLVPSSVISAVNGTPSSLRITIPAGQTYMIANLVVSRPVNRPPFKPE